MGDTVVISADIELMGGSSQSATVGKILLTSFYKKLVWISHSRSGFLYARTDYCTSTSLWMLTDFTCFLGLWMISTLFVLACRHNKRQMHTLHAWQKAIELFTKFIIHFLTYRAEYLFSPEFTAYFTCSTDLFQIGWNMNCWVTGPCALATLISGRKLLMVL